MNGLKKLAVKFKFSATVGALTTTFAATVIANRFYKKNQGIPNAVNNDNTVWVTYDTTSSACFNSIMQQLNQSEQRYTGQHYFIPMTTSASNKLNKSDDNSAITVIDLNKILERDANTVNSDNPPLNKEELKKFIDFIKSKNAKKVITGTDSVHTEIFPIMTKQLAMMPTIQFFVYHSYLFIDENSLDAFSKILADKENNPWLRNIKGILVTTNKARQYFEKHYPQYKFTAVGSPVLQNDSDNFSKEKTKIIRSQLNLGDNQKLLVFAGTKNFLDDEDVFKTVVKYYKKQMPSDETIQAHANQIFMAIPLHPGTDNLEDKYIKSMLKIIREAEPPFPVKIILTDYLCNKHKINPEEYKNNPYVLYCEEMSGNELVDHCDMLVDFQAAGMTGRALNNFHHKDLPIYNHNRDCMTFLSTGRNYFQGEKQLPDFIKQTGNEYSNDCLKQQVEQPIPESKNAYQKNILDAIFKPN